MGNNRECGCIQSLYFGSELIENGGVIAPLCIALYSAAPQFSFGFLCVFIVKWANICIGLCIEILGYSHNNCNNNNDNKKIQHFLCFCICVSIFFFLVEFRL